MVHEVIVCGSTKNTKEIAIIYRMYCTLVLCILCAYVSRCRKGPRPDSTLHNNMREEKSVLFIKKCSAF